jgi:murein L,D-transpeptidase YafK
MPFKLHASILFRLVLCLGLFISHPAGAPPGVMAGVSDAGPDATLALVYRDIAANKLDLALTRTENLLRLYPNFRLAHLVRGDLLLARVQPLTTLGNAANAPADRLKDLREEAQARLKGFRNRPTRDYIPRYLLQMQADQSYAIVVDTLQSRLYLFRNDQGRPVFIADYYVSQGRAGAFKEREGDLKTPVGVYRVTSELSAQKIGDFYGKRAFPLNYPNEWDRMQGRNGHGIWLHGVPADTYARPPRASEGCVVLANQDLDALAAYMQIGVTPVIITNGVEWLSLGDWQEERAALDKAIEDWRQDWESRDIARYMRHYSKKFKVGDQNFQTWEAQKRAVNAQKSWVKVSLNKLSAFRSPGKDDLAQVSFDQDYRSSNLSNVSRKLQYWIKEEGHWKIIFEGAS